jgi:putative Mn2+ efflux pump MntP
LRTYLRLLGYAAPYKLRITGAILCMIVLSLATSVDGLVVGVPLAMLDGSVVFPGLVSGVVVACLTGLGVLAGSHVGSAWGRRAELAGGLGLFVIAAKILLAHILAS